MKLGNNPKNYKMWMTQKSNQERYAQMERAMMAQMQAEAHHQEMAKLGIQQQMDEMKEMDEMDAYGEELP